MEGDDELMEDSRSGGAGEEAELEEGSGEDVQLQGGSGSMEGDDELVEDWRSGGAGETGENEELVESPEMDGVDNALCGSCGSEVPMSSEKCPECGTEFA